MCVGPIHAGSEHGVIDAGIHDDLPIFGLVSIRGMEDVTGFDLTPDDALCTAFTGQKPDPGPVLRVPLIREAGPADQRAHGEGDRKVHDDHVVWRDHAVMDHGPILNRDRFFATHASIRAQDDMPDGVRNHRIVADGVHLSGRGIEMRVGREGLAECSAEGRMLPRFDVSRDFDRMAARLHDGPEFSGMADDVGIGGVGARVTFAGCTWLAQRVTDRI